MKISTIDSILKSPRSEQEVIVSGWVRSVRTSKKFSFIVLNDGSSHSDFQIIADMGISGYEELKGVLTGSSLEVYGVVKESQGKNQGLELHASKIIVLGLADETYPLQKKSTSVEFLREKAHLRVRTRLFSAIYKIRHQLSMSTHQFFSDRGFIYVHTPILTGIDAEGAGEMFSVTTLNLKDLPKLPSGDVDYSKDYFQKETSLCVTGQLEAESLAMGLGRVYTFGPTFRSENSNTTRHLSEFWMIEPEMAFFDLEDTAILATEYIKSLVSDILLKRREELEFVLKWQSEDLLDSHIQTLEKLANDEFVKISYTEAISILNNSGKSFEFPTEWGCELHTEHERFLTDEHFNLPVIVTDYPKDCKAFYMKMNEDQKTVRAMDILVPGVGEIIGGSQREESLQKLEKRIEDMGMQRDALEWYLDLRRFGTVTHSGFGLGLERILLYITQMGNIRDVIPFPRTPRSCEF